MSAISILRGHEIYFEGKEWFFSDTGDPVIVTWKDRPCGYCDRANTQEGHDGCIGRLPGVMNACCGHGESRAYVQFPGGLILRGFIAHMMISFLKTLTRWQAHKNK